MPFSSIDHSKEYIRGGGGREKETKKKQKIEREKEKRKHKLFGPEKD